MNDLVSNLKNSINRVRYNPAAIQRESLNLLEKVSNGEIDIVDPSNPFVFLLESSAVNASAAMTEAEALTRKQYSSMAITEEELYLHMSDKDFIGRFSTPSRTVFTVLLNKEEVINKAVATDVPGIRKIEIPRNTEFTVSNYTFTMEYPIDIRVVSHGGIQVVYNVTVNSPLQILESNIVDWDLVTFDGNEYVRIRIPVNQFKVTTYYAQLNESVKYNKTFTLSDDFYYCRVYRKSNGAWVDIKTTHTDQVFDPNTPTVVLNVVNNTLNVTVPPVYVTTGLLNGDLRFDIYTTKGPLDLILDSYAINLFSVNWRDISLGNKNQFSSPLNTFSGLILYSDSVVTGGTKKLSFEQIRERVITNSLGDSQLPITNIQLSTRLENLGYNSIKDVDNITNRIYLASRRLPPPSTGSTISGTGCMIGTLRGSYEDFKMTGGEPIILNDKRLTFTTDVLYYRDNGIIKIVSESKRTEINDLLAASSKTAFILEMNSDKYLYSPFHYVLDSNDDHFESRAYYLNSPVISGRKFVEENDSLQLLLSSRAVNVFKDSTGYTIQLHTTSSDVIKELNDEDVLVQLSYTPPNASRDVFLTGHFISRDEENERIFEFTLESKFDIDSSDNIIFDNFLMFTDDVRSFSTGLLTNFNLVYYIKNYNPFPLVPHNLAYDDGLVFLDDTYYGVTHELLSVKFGTRLNGLWENSRSTVKPNIYRVYEEDVLAFYEENVYERDPVTGHLALSLDVGGNIVYTILHHAGDPVIDPDTGVQKIKHRAGDPILNASGEIEILESRDILREFDIFLIDAKYIFATREVDRNYVFNDIPKTIINWLENDINSFRDWALEQTEIYFYPQKTLGISRVTVNEAEIKNIETEQSFVVRYFLAGDKYQNNFLRQVLTDLAVEVISDELRSSRVATNQIVSKLTARAGEDIIAVEIEGLGGNLNLPLVTINSDAERFSIRKRLEGTLDGRLQVVDDVTVVFIRH